MGLEGDSTVPKALPGATVSNTPLIPRSSPNVSPIVITPRSTPNTGNTRSNVAGIPEAAAAAAEVSPPVLVATAAAAVTVGIVISLNNQDANPSLPLPGFLGRDNTGIKPITVPLPLPGTGTKPVTAPPQTGTPTNLYEIGGWDLMSMGWITLKYGVASTSYDTYGGKSNRRPDSQLDAFRNKYPSMMIGTILLGTYPTKELAHIAENNAVFIFRSRNRRPDPTNPFFGLPPIEQGLPYGLGPR